MALRFTATEKWNDSWFSGLKPNSKLLFIFLYENCNLAGFIEVNKPIWAVLIGVSIGEINKSLDELGKSIITSKNGDCLFVRNFLKHQKNLPLNENNKAHIAIIRQFAEYAHKFEAQTIDELIGRGIEGGSKGDRTPPGIGIGIGIGNNIEEDEKILNWKNSFEIYKHDLRDSYQRILTQEYIADREKYHPGLDIKLTIEKACVDFWSTEKGWNYKKKSKIEEINWKATFNNTLSEKWHQVWKPKNGNKPATTESVQKIIGVKDGEPIYANQ